MIIPILIFIDCADGECAVTNVLIDSLCRRSSMLLSVTPRLAPQLDRMGLDR